MALTTGWVKLSRFRQLGFFSFIGFDDPGHNFMNYGGFAPTVPNEWFKDNVMKQGGDPYAKPLPFRGDKNQRAIDEVNRAKPFPQ